jgi:cytochrome d ubiquinol oxidase subunit II
MDASSITTFWAALLAFAIIFYVILDGFDLGVGILSGTTRNEGLRTGMMHAISPFWDGNEVWLILIGAGLFGAFPLFYSIFLPALYVPLALMLFGLIFRGVSFEFRDRAGNMRWLWEWGFFLGSLVAAFVQGAAIGRIAQGVPVFGGQYVNVQGSFDWLTPFPIICGIGLVFGYALLGAGWLVLKTNGPLKDWAYQRMGWLLLGALIFLAFVFSVTIAADIRVRTRWLGNPWLIVFPLIVAVASYGLLHGARRKIDGLPYPMAVVVFLASYLALAGSFWPYMIPYSVTITNAAAPVETLRFLFYGAGIVIFPLILIYTGVVYWTLRGKS